MRARLKSYDRLSRFCHEMNVQRRAEPRGIEDVPG
jgi:hypothetical protein